MANTMDEMHRVSLPEKRYLGKCNPCGIISQARKVRLIVYINRMEMQAEHIFSQEETGFGTGRSTVEQIRSQCENSKRETTKHQTESP